MSSLNEFLSTISGFVWGPLVLIPLLLGTGIYLSARLGLLQFRFLRVALRHAFLDGNEENPADPIEGDISNYQALTTALAATVGVGNIVGVATALSIGGPGSLFWIWVTGLVGMASKYAEAYLGIRFRTQDVNGEQAGGPQQYLRRGIPGLLGKILAFLFTIFAILASFGIGNLSQANAVSAGMAQTFGASPALTGALLFVFIGAVLLGGIKSIGRITAAFVPLMIIIYVLGGLVVLGLNLSSLPQALGEIFQQAFTGTAATGGFTGSALLVVIQYGVARGIFSNESGMGSAAIAAAAAKTTHPVRQGLVSMTQTFIDTIIVVTITGLCIVTTGVWNRGASQAGTMTADAFATVLPGHWGGMIVSMSIIFFAFSTILGWAYYGERCIVCLFGHRASLPYRMFFTAMVFVGATTELTIVWTFSDLANGLMALPNLIGLLLLSGLVARETKAYLRFDPRLTASSEAVKEHLAQQQITWR